MTSITNDLLDEVASEVGEWLTHYIDGAAIIEITPPLKGLGSDIDLVRRIVADDKGTFDLLDQALQNPVGHPPIGNNVPDRPEGNTQAKALRTLHR